MSQHCTHSYFNHFDGLYPAISNLKKKILFLDLAISSKLCRVKVILSFIIILAVNTFLSLKKFCYHVFCTYILTGKYTPIQYNIQHMKLSLSLCNGICFWVCQDHFLYKNPLRNILLDEYINPSIWTSFCEIFLLWVLLQVKISFLQTFPEKWLIKKSDNHRIPDNFHLKRLHWNSIRS